MRVRTLLGLFVLTAAAGYGCSDARDLPLLPASGANRSLATTPGRGLGAPQRVPVVLRPRALPAPITVTERIGEAGGVISIPEAGFALYIPENALTLPVGNEGVDITVTALRGPHVAYEFEPHGLVFRTPAYAVQDARATKARLPDGTLSGARGAYFPDAAGISDGGADVTEYQETYLDSEEARYYWEINHFSGYLLAADRGSRR
jgi:hypothetical protein